MSTGVIENFWLFDWKWVRKTVPRRVRRINKEILCEDQKLGHLVAEMTPVMRGKDKY